MAEPLSPFVAWLHKMMRYLPHLAIVASLLVYAFFILTERYSSIFNLSLYLIPLIGISIVLIANKKFSCDDSAALFNISFKRLRNAHLIIFSLTIICLGFGHDGWVYLALMFVQYCLLLAQLFAKDQNAKWIVAGVMLTTSILVLPQMLIPAYYCGDTDLLFHSMYASTIADEGFISTGYGGTYESFCAYHILIAAFSELTGLVINVSLYLVSTVSVLFSIPIVYAMTKLVTKSERIGVFATFFYALLPIIINSLMIPAPRVMASIAFFLVVYILFRYLSTSRWKALVLSVILLCYMVQVHHAQLIFIVAVTAGLLFGVLLYIKKLNWKMIIGGGVVLAVPMYVLVTRYSSTLTSIIQNRLLGQIEGGNLGDIVIESTANAEMSVIEQLFSINFSHTLTVLASSVIIVFVFAGLYALLTNITVRKKICVILPLVLLTFVVFVPGIVDLFPTISDSFQIYRFRIVLSMFFAIMMAIGFSVMLNISKTKAKKNLMLLLTIGLCIILIISSPIVSGTESNDVFCGISNTYTERYYVESDVILLQKLTEIIPFKKETSNLYTTGNYEAYFTKGITNNPFRVASIDTRQLFINHEMVADDNMNYILFRHEKYNQHGLTMGAGIGQYIERELVFISQKTYDKKIFDKNINKYNSIYESNTNRVYYDK